MYDLLQKAVIITGGAGLLGREFAETVASINGLPIILDINEEAARNVAENVQNKYGVPAISFGCDITREERVNDVAKELDANGVHVYGLINNAAMNPAVSQDGEFKNSRVEDFNLTQWNQEIAVGLTGAFLCAKHFGMLIKECGCGGVIINVSSDLGLIAPDQRLYSEYGDTERNRQVKPVSYSVIKAGLIGLTRYFATYWPEFNIRCNALCPGGVYRDQPVQFVQRIEKLVPLGRMANFQDYNSTIIWMLAEQTSYLNGAVIAVDGGRTAW